MKKYLLLMMITMSVIFVVPVMAETNSSTVSPQPAESETQSMVETPEETTKAPIIVTKAHSKGPGELLETTEEETQATTEAVETPAPQAGNRWGVVLNEEEKDLLARITMLESGGESDRGQQAVVEVILNRVYSPSYPNSVYGVLSHVDCGYRQFSTWKSRNSRSAIPSARVVANVNAVLNGETNILPFETVYFSRKAANRRVQERIGNHVFCNR